MLLSKKRAALVGACAKADVRWRAGRSSIRTNIVANYSSDVALVRAAVEGVGSLNMQCNVQNQGGVAFFSAI